MKSAAQLNFSSELQSFGADTNTDYTVDANSGPDSRVWKELSLS